MLPRSEPWAVFMCVFINTGKSQQSAVGIVSSLDFNSVELILVLATQEKLHLCAELLYFSMGVWSVVGMLIRSLVKSSGDACIFRC